MSLTQTTDEYIELAKHIAVLVESELLKTEQLTSEGRVDVVISMLPKLISMVNMVGYLRGQDGTFLDTRPSVGEHQSELYALEDACEARLRKLITYVCTNENGAKATEAQIREYYLTNRLPHTQ
ncbi:MAG: hypothetical protein KBD24_04145 [Candidatus Pacebacteria bacterium]|nr:hypothetical protein [Candidatus Paceibacterota bacterium]